MSLVHRCLIIPAAIKAQCQALPEASGMWTTALSLTGTEPATHYISSGLVDKAFADLLASPVALAAASGVTLKEAQVIVAGMNASDDDPHTAMQAMGLALVVEGEA